MADLFVSYSRKDSDLVVRLHNRLKESGRETWVDWEGIPPTAEWLAEIRAAIEAADSFVFVLSPDSLSSKICGLEVEHAVLHRKRLIPVVHRDVDAALVPESLGAVNWIFFREQDDFESAFERLVRALDTDLGWVKEHTRLLVRAVQWDGRTRNDAFLLRGSDLKSAEAWLASAGAQKDMRPTELQGQYITASRRGATRRLRVLLGGVAFAAVLAVVLAVVALWQSKLAEQQRVIAVDNAKRADISAGEARDNAKKAEQNARVAEQRRGEAEEQRRVAVEERNTALSRELATHSAVNLSSDPELSLLLAREAAAVKPTDQAETMLRSSILQSHVRMVLRGHTEALKTAAFRNDGKRLATAAGEFGRIWDVESGKTMCELKGHTGTIWHIEFSPDGKHVITSGDFAGRIWDAETGTLLHTLPGNKEEFQIWAEFSPDGKQALTAGRNESSTGESLGRIWDVASGKLVTELKGLRDALTHAEFSRDGRLVITASFDESAGGAVWDARTGKRLYTLGGHEEVVRRVKISPDSRRFLTASHDKTARLWNSDGKLIATLAGHDETLTTAAFSPNSRRVATASKDGTTRIWSADKGTPIAELRGHSGQINSIEFSRDGRWLLSASEDGTARVWAADAPGAKQARDPDMSDETKQVGWRAVAVLAGHQGSVQAAVFHPDGQRVATAGLDRTARIWSPHRWDPVVTMAAGNEGKPVFVQGGSYLMTVPESTMLGRRVRIWRTRTGEQVGEPSLHAVFSSDGLWAATSHAHHTSVWDLKSWKRVTTIPGGGAAFFRNGKWLATSEEKRLLIWETGTWRNTASLQARNGGDFAESGQTFSIADDSVELRWTTGTWEPLPPLAAYKPIGGARRWFARDFGDDLDIYETRTGRWVTRLEPGIPQKLRGAVTFFDFSPTGRYLGAALLNGDARVWEMGTWRPVATLRGHRGELHSIAFSPDERFVATAGEDKSARLWDISTGQPFAELLGHSASVTAVAFSPDGRSIATMSEDDTAQIYRCDVCAPIKELATVAAGRATRNFTPAEKARFLRDPKARSEDREILVARGRELAMTGDVAGAKRLFEKAIANGAKLFRGPENEAKFFAAETAKSRGVSAKFSRKPPASPPHEEDPILSEAKYMAYGGDAQATRQVLNKAPGVKDPDKQAAELVAAALKSLSAEIGNLSRYGHYRQALALLDLRPWVKPAVSNDAWTSICYDGAKQDAGLVLSSCDRAVQTAPGSLFAHITRAFARASSNNFMGAAEDVAAALVKSNRPKHRREMERVLAELRSGRDPFRKSGTADEELLESLRYPSE